MRDVFLVGALVLAAGPSFAVSGDDGSGGPPQKLRWCQEDLSGIQGVDDYSGLVWLQLHDDLIGKDDFESMTPERQRGALRTASKSAGKRWQEMADLRQQFEQAGDQTPPSELQGRLQADQQWLGQSKFADGKEQEIAARYLNVLAPLQQKIIAKARPTDDQLDVQRKQAEITQKAVKKTGTQVKSQGGGWFDQFFGGGGSVNPPPPAAPRRTLPDSDDPSVADRDVTPLPSPARKRQDIWGNQQPPPTPKKKISDYDSSKPDAGTSDGSWSFKKFWHDLHLTGD